MKKNRWLTVEELAKRWRMSPKTIYNKIAPKSKQEFPIKHKRIGRLARFHIEDVLRFEEMP